MKKTILIGIFAILIATVNNTANAASSSTQCRESTYVKMTKAWTFSYTVGQYTIVGAVVYNHNIWTVAYTVLGPHGETITGGVHNFRTLVDGSGNKYVDDSTSEYEFSNSTDEDVFFENGFDADLIDAENEFLLTV
jgi:uncharacterized protein YxeA